MHNAAFAATRLPHCHHCADVAAVEEFCSNSDFFQASEFAGASVTIPHKQAIIPYVDVMSEAAQAIGSVNTLIVKDEIKVEERLRKEGR
jgi:pentafunctional AROM polypeptide